MSNRLVLVPANFDEVFLRPRFSTSNKNEITKDNNWQIYMDKTSIKSNKIRVVTKKVHGNSFLHRKKYQWRCGVSIPVPLAC